ncbi:MAG: hypothetical protein JWP97_6181 [Labilithrix sp.]|nr:hypothetical protein [Labilithrix sp.]
MSISSIGAAAVSAASLDKPYSIAVAVRSLDAQKMEGQNALALIASATPAPLQPGHQLSVVA